MVKYISREITVEAVRFRPAQTWPEGMEQYVPLIKDTCHKCGRDFNTHGVMESKRGELTIKDVYCPGDYVVVFEGVSFPMESTLFMFLFREKL